MFSGQPKQSSGDDRELIQAGFRYALSLTHNRHDAEDLVQQACLRVYKSKGRLVGKSYLFVAIRNLYVDRYRRGDQSETERLHNDAEVLDATANHVDVVNHQLDIDNMLSCLRDEERELLYLNCVEGYTAADISKITGKPRNTVLSQLARAKKKLVVRFDAHEV